MLVSRAQVGRGIGILLSVCIFIHNLVPSFFTQYFVGNGSEMSLVEECFV